MSSREVKHSKGRTSCTFNFVPEFATNMQNPSTCFDEFSVLSFRKILSRDEDEKLLSPVRTVRLYLRRISNITKDPGRHLCTGWLKKKIMWSMIACWSPVVMDHAYSTASVSDCRAAKMKEHKVCGITPS